MKDTSLIAEIEGYAARYNEPDLNGDIIMPGAFKKTLNRQASTIRMLYQHAAEQPIGRWINFRDTKDGLIVTGEILLASPRAHEVYALVAGGALDGLSIGYQTVRARKAPGDSARTRGRRIVEADLWEVSIVTFPMAPKARITRIDAPTTISQDPLHVFLPRALQPTREAGFLPQAQASRDGRASDSPQPDARHFACALTKAASILSV